MDRLQQIIEWITFGLSLSIFLTGGLIAIRQLLITLRDKGVKAFLELLIKMIPDKKIKQLPFKKRK